MAHCPAQNRKSPVLFPLKTPSKGYGAMVADVLKRFQIQSPASTGSSPYLGTAVLKTPRHGTQ